MLDALPATEARAVLYYAARIVKQAEYFHVYSKDIFADLGETDLAHTVKSTVAALIAELERQEGSTVALFSSQSFGRTMSQIAEKERSLGGRFSAAQIARGQAFLNAMKIDED